MKYWRGYLTAVIIAAIAGGLTWFASGHRALVDMVYPYVTRLVQTTLAQWSAGVDFCVWQVLAILLIVILLATIVLMIIFRWNFVQWLGWVLSAVALLWTMQVGLYGLNNYAGPLADDIRLKVTKYNITELAEATVYFRDRANALSSDIPRNETGSVQFPSFEEMANIANDGYEILTYEQSLSVFAGATVPVKKLEWADMYTSMGISGITMPFTGEAAVNPNLPAVSIPFTMCHELAHRRCIVSERDANLSAYLACNAHPNTVFQYSGYFMAFRYCYFALASIDTSTAANVAREIYAGISPGLKHDMQEYQAYLTENQTESATNFATSVNDTYLKASGNTQGVQSYGEVCDLLVSWYIQEIYLPEHQDEEEGFDPTDKSQVELSAPLSGNGWDRYA